MSSNVVKIGMREFRAHMPQYLLAPAPVAITRHGETVGFYIPAHHHVENSDLAALKKAASQLDQLLIANGLTEDELVSEFRALRESKDK
ncbi:MAG: hypothetical protein WC756_20255 [Taibaiella sp.]|jgi:hypothetical protein